MHYVVLEIDAEVVGADRDDLLAALAAENIRARRYFYPGCHWSEPYRSDLAPPATRLPHTERLAASVLVMPTGVQTPVAGAERAGEVLRYMVEHGRELHAALARTSADRPPSGA